MSECLKPQTGDMLSTDGTRLFYRWHPVSEARASVVLVHGFAEHSGRYGGVISRFNDAALNVLAFDYRGHGLAEGRKVYIDRFAEYVEDTRCALDFIEDRTQGVPVFLLGHSQGGLIALLTALSHQARLAGCVLSSPALGIALPIPAWKDALGKVMARVMPGLAIPSGLDPNLVSRDPEAVRAYIDDPLIPTFARARWYVCFTEAQAEMERRAPEIRLPTLMLQAGADGVVDPVASERVAGRLGSDDVTFKLLPGLFHELFHEPEKEEVLDEIVSWISARAPSPTG